MKAVVDEGKEDLSRHRRRLQSDFVHDIPSVHSCHGRRVLLGTTPEMTWSGQDRSGQSEEGQDRSGQIQSSRLESDKKYNNKKKRTRRRRTKERKETEVTIFMLSSRDLRNYCDLTVQVSIVFSVQQGLGGLSMEVSVRCTAEAFDRIHPVGKHLNE